MLRANELRRSLHSLILRLSDCRPLFPPHRRLFCAIPTPPPISTPESEIRKYIGYTVLLLGCGAATYYSFPFPENAKHKKAQIFNYAPLPQDLHSISNWSGTHEVQTRTFIQPESLSELEAVVEKCNGEKQKIRPVGSGLSPNGIGLTRSGMINLALMDRVLEVDEKTKRVRVEAGIRVQQLVDAIKEYGLTLENFASIREQQIAGIVQVGAHGTGPKLPPIDEQVISLKLVTPAKGTIEVSKEKNPQLFHLARCGLGGLGVVAEVTLQCVDRHQLVEHTYVSNMMEIKRNHKKLLSENKHIKYLYIPYTDAVVVVTCNPLSKWRGPPKNEPKFTEEEALQHVEELYRESLRKYRKNNSSSMASEENKPLSFTELRDHLIALDPLNKDHIVKINEAEAEFWRKSEGYRVGWSDEILGFDCGGQQWVSETCFPAGTLSNPSMKDLEYVENLLELIEKNDVPSPAPIEQRWTGRSRSVMSPAYSSSTDDIFSWVGIIMYLPTMDPRGRKRITEEFFHYRWLTQKQLWDDFSAYEHWAKVEIPKEKDELTWLQTRLRKKFPVDEYNRARKELDPNNILSNSILGKLFPMHE
ncbi:l-galactono-1,4-lactone dehydrogenase [Genlisea aurea]|uniref:L-galactono-1,4-lactone dehydrogenase n=1 Tax=Genlisea aurea TaxID=192259 RepID=S8E2S9_9LAMI|nr:l-galactono-1,4-lactone dehydrogenase [Genlisea aurea]